jgi:predicted AAA+ superfamily ATPase
LARVILQTRPSCYLDLERPSDRAKLHDPEAFFKLQRGRLVCLDEVQRMADIFPVLRSILDETGKNGQILVLGSASPDLLRQSSETLAGRISYLELAPFSLLEVGDDEGALRRWWTRGGFPRSYLARSDAASLAWREDFIRTFLERDIPQFGIRIPAQTLRRFWMMCAHNHGRVLNSSQLGQSLGLSHTTVRSYVDLLEQTFLLRVLPPFEANLKKRLVRSPKVYLRDSGLLHTLLDLPSAQALLGHPVYGASWEGLVIESILSVLGRGWQAGFYRTSTGTELDLILERGDERIGIECKASSAPTLSKGFWNALEDLNIRKAFVVAPVSQAYPIGKDVRVMPLRELMLEIQRCAS